MLRQNFGQSGQKAKTVLTGSNAGMMKETAGDEAVRNAYMSLAGQSGRVISGKALKNAMNRSHSSHAPRYSGREPFSLTTQESFDTKTPRPSRENKDDFPDRNAAGRSLKLPNFLVGPEVKSKSHPKKRRNSELIDITAGIPPGRTLLPPIPQNLLGESKHQSISQPQGLQPDSRVATSGLTKQTITQPTDQNLNLKKDQGQTESAVPSFASFLTEAPARTENSEPSFNASDVPVERDSDWVNRYQNYESAWVKLLDRPKLLLSLLGLGIVSCSVYIAMGYWWFGSSPVSQAAEPLTMLNVQEEAIGKKDEQNATSTFNNIHSLQHGDHPKESKHPITRPATAKADKFLLAQAHPAPVPTNAPTSNTTSTSNTAPTSNKEPMKYEATGRPDPFSPLVTTDGGSTLEKPAEEVKQDIFSEISYTGFIGDINSPDKVAIIKVNDPSTNTAKTYIKKAGEAININGERVIVKAISKKNLLMSGSGEMRHLPIQQFQTLKSSPSGAGGGSAPGGSGPSGPAQPSGFSSGPMGGSGSDTRSPNAPLKEPAS